LLRTLQERPSEAWEPVINLRVANALQVRIKVDLETRKVAGIESAPALQRSAPKGDGKTAAGKMVEQDNTGRNIPLLAVSNSSALPLIVISGAVPGGAAAGISYYIKRQDNNC